MTLSGAGAGLLGRQQECQALDGLLAGARAGRSAALVLRGEAGIGKTALLGHLERASAGSRLLRAAGVESEMELAFAGLHQLCAPLLEGLDSLPQPQAGALGTAFGLRGGPPPDRFLVGLAVLTLLSEHPTDGPIVCLVDDAQWLDRASGQCLAFAARRLGAEGVVLVFATRPHDGELTWAGLPQLTVRGLADVEATAVLETAAPTPLDARVRQRILVESRGNPLALLQLADSLSAAELTFGPERRTDDSVTGQMQERFARQLADLPSQTQLLLLVAAAEPLGDPGLLWAAAERLDIGTVAAGPAEAAGLLAVGTTVTFRHPLVRSAAYRSADPQDVRRVHGVLAEVTDPDRDPDRRAWHRAHAAPGPDEAVAAELERSADRALSHGGLAAAAALLEQASRVTPDEMDQVERALRAAESALGAGLLDDVQRLLVPLERRALDELQRARCEVLRAQIAFASNRGGDAVFLLLAAASRLEPLVPERACDTYAAALQACLFVGRLAPDPGLAEVARAARHAPVADPPRLIDQLMLGFAALFEDGLASAAPQLRRAYQAFIIEDVRPEEAGHHPLFAVRAAFDLWDLSAWTTLSGRMLELARASGALVTLQLALSADFYAQLFNGNLATASARLDEAQLLVGASGIPVSPAGPIAMAALRGDLASAATVIAPAEEDALARREGLVVCFAKWARAVLCNGNGRYQEALAHCRELLVVPGDGRLTVAPFELTPNAWALAELVEAAVRCGELATATAAADLMSEVAAACPTDWALGVAARLRAQLSEGETAESLYREAIERLERDGVGVEHARTLLLYGEWLRREGRRSDARKPLQHAYDSLSAMGVLAFAERARHELAATGRTVARRQVPGERKQLTPQELHIARLAAEGYTNPEIGAEVYLSRHTVEWHLKKVFVKLGVTSRLQLRRALGEPGARA